MKSKKIVIFLSMILLSGCIKDTLNRKPLNIISDADVWVSEDLIKSYMVPLYDAMPMGFFVDYGNIYSANIADESSGGFSWYNIESNYGNVSLTLNTDMYTWIRKVNYLIKRVQTATIPEASIKEFVAEGRFIRAFYYFDLVKKYGGMPIIQEVQVFNNNLDSLQVPRNTEAEVYDFILNDLDAAIADLPDSRDASNSNRATKMVAQALKSRAMLYAGSIAKYGSVQLNGLIGIPASKANTYFTESINASKAVMESNEYGLYDKFYNPASKTGDPVKNYTQIFVDKDNKEVIFQKTYSYPDKIHSYDATNRPAWFSGGSGICPVLDLVEAYEYIDGTPGTLNVDGKVFDSPDDLFRNKDPRFDASILRSGSIFAGDTMQIYRGIYDTDGTLYESEQVPFPKDPSTLQVGISGPYPRNGYSKTGFYIRKILNMKSAREATWSDQNYIEIRYAEILLNYTEAALEMGTNLPQALDAINEVRNRAGIKLLTSGELTIDRLRNERRVELAFEDKRFWDMRRWRIGRDLFKNTLMRGLWPYLKYTGSGYKYTFEKISGYPIEEGLSRVFEEKDYYSNLSTYISTDQNIINNPGW
jgi:hypothetical protein